MHDTDLCCCSASRIFEHTSRKTASMARTKIVCTLGPASEDAQLIRALIDAGMRVARINCSHGTPQEHAERVKLVRSMSDEAGVAVAVLFDLSGPKVRTGSMAEPVMLEAGVCFTMTARDALQPGEVPLGIKALPQYVSAGQHILLDDGNLIADIESVTETDIVCRAQNSGLLSSHKGINLPGVSLPIPAVTEKDLVDLRHGLELGVDWIAMSFVRNADDLEPVRALMNQLGHKRPIIAKIEKHEAIENLDAIIDAFDGIMVARGDLGVEVALERIPLLQKDIIRKANRAGKPVITATQMLDSMMRNPRPTRAEVTDVANAILDGTDAVMLSGETSIGKYPVETVRTMALIADWAETAQPVNAVAFDKAPAHATPDGALAAAAVDIADTLQASAIIASTESGYTATLVSKSRPKGPIFALTQNAQTHTQLALLWGVTPFFIRKEGASDDELLDRMVRRACTQNMLMDGNLLVIISVTSQAVGVITRASNMLRIAHVRHKGCGPM